MGDDEALSTNELIEVILFHPLTRMLIFGIFPKDDEWSGNNRRLAALTTQSTSYARVDRELCQFRM